MGRAFVDYLGARRIAVGRDCPALLARDRRPPSSRAPASQGAEVTDIGVVGTDMLYYYVRAATTSTAAPSSPPPTIPKEWNGIKMVRRGAPRPLRRRRDQGDPEAVAGRPLRRRSRRPRAPAPSAAPSREDYARHCLSFIDPARVPRLKVVLDTANGMGAVGAAAIFPHLPVETVRMYFDLDGTFPNHPADPLLEENRREIDAARAWRRAPTSASPGTATPTAASSSTTQGAFVPGDFVTALLGEAFARREPGARIVYDVRASRAVADRVERRGRRALMNRVGHAFIKKRMRDENGVFGGEVSGHFYFRDNWYADNGMIPALLVLELLGTSGQEAQRDRWLPCASATTSRARSTPRWTTCRAPSPGIEERYADGRITRLDGISVDYDDWHFNVRASNTEPLLRLNLEAVRRGDMERRRDEVLALIRG